MPIKKLLIWGLIAALIGAFFAFDLQHWLTLETLKNSMGQLAAWRDTHPLVARLGFFASYVLVTALSLPGAAVMTLAAGALFGLVWGTLLVSFASSIGATLAFLVARYLLRDSLRRKFGQRLAAIDAGIQKEGAFYLFTLRLVPIFPFFIINLLMGLTAMRVITFYVISQIGMLAGTLVYVNGGTQLARIDSLSGLLSPALLGSFALLGVFPLLAKWGVGRIKRRRVYARWDKPKHFDRNLVVIGAGAAGLVSAYIAAAVKAKVTLVESHKMGGDCLNYGCVPSKALIQSARVAHTLRHAQRYGLNPTQAGFSFKAVMARVHRVISAIEPHDSVARYTALGVDVRQGHARLLSPWTVEITTPDGDTQTLTTRNIIIAAGARPFVPPLPGLDDVGYVTSDTLWDTFSQYDQPPARLVVLGGGPIGCELAQAMARLGSTVTQVEMAPRLMLREDEEVSAYVQTMLEQDGVTVLTGHKALRCEPIEGEKTLVVEGPQGEQSIAFDELLCAVGRAPRLSGYGLEELGIETQRTVVTNAYLETLYPNILAAGDVAGPYAFTHTAAHQAWFATVNALFGRFKKFKADYSVIPWVTFTAPEVARVGLNEQDARDQGVACEVTRYGVDELDRAITESHDTGFIKVLTTPGKDRILGVTVVSEHAGELLAEWVLAMKHGLGLNKLLGTIHAYPTWNEANKYTAGVWKQAHTSPRVLTWLERYHRWMRH